MPVTPRKPWTVLIYMVADDPQGGELLDKQAVREMDLITKATLSVNSAQASDQLYVALQVDFRTLPGVWRRVIGDSAFVRPEGDSADPATLYGFFEWAADKCPADRYLLIFWGHSRGQFGLFGDPDPFSYTAQTLTLDELRVAMMAAKRSLGKAVDIIAFKDCFMATLETAYELSGLADYLLASPSLVPVEGWPYEAMFRALAEDAGQKGRKGKEEPLLDKARQLFGALEEHYSKDENIKPYKEVPYSLLSTRGASKAVAKLTELIGKDRTFDIKRNEQDFRALLAGAAMMTGGDPALVDLGALALGDQQTAVVASMAGAAVDRVPEKFATDFKGFARALGNARRRPSRGGAAAAASVYAKNALDPPPDVASDLRVPVDEPADEGLVIDHSGKCVGGVGVFVYPSSPKAVRDSLLTRLAGEKAYRQLAISADTNWADIALESMPIQQARPTEDISTVVGLLEQLERLGVGMGFGLGASTNGYYRSLAERSRSGGLTDADVAQATEYAAIAEIAGRLAAFAARKGTDGLGPKGTDGLVGKKGTDGLASKGTDGLVSGT